MKIIEDYLNSLYVNNDSKEVKELKEEIKEHLLSYTDEYIQKGYSINDAQCKAISQFGDVDESLMELNSIYKNRIDIKKEQIKKLSSLRWKVINIFGWLLAATFFTAYMTIDTIVPTWLIVLLSSSIITLIVLSILILILQKKDII